MTDEVIVRVMPDDSGRIEWLEITKEDREKISAVKHGALLDFSEELKKKRVILLIPGEHALITHVKAPGGSVRDQHASLPYLLEERLIEDVEKLHFVAGPKQASGLLPVVIISKNILDKQLNQFWSAGVFPSQVIPEPLALSYVDGEWSILIDGKRAVVRYGEYSGFGCSSEQVVEILARLRDESLYTGGMENSKESAMTVNIYADSPSPELMQQLENKRFVINAHTGFGLSQLLAIGHKKPVIDLAQGYAGPSEFANRRENRWLPSIFLVAAFVIYIGVSGYQYWSQYKDEEKIQSDIYSLFQSTFPEVKRIVDPMKQGRHLLNEKRKIHKKGDDDLLSLMYISGEAFQANPNLSFSAFEFRQGVMQIRLKGGNLQTIEEFKNYVESDKTVIVEILSTVADGNEIEAKIKLKRI
ncbi:MAG: type II secretion system protein GspL [Chromatiales bacterium]|jgi:type II secretion system protein L